MNIPICDNGRESMGNWVGRFVDQPRIEVLYFCSHFTGQTSLKCVHINIKGVRKYSSCLDNPSQQCVYAIEGSLTLGEGGYGCFCHIGDP